ncbi:hypothetical protein M080_6973, partial [Bacteroides fragilis str. 3397 T10]
MLVVSQFSLFRFCFSNNFLLLDGCKIRKVA